MTHPTYHHQRSSAHPALLLGTVFAVGLALYIGIHSHNATTQPDQGRTKIDQLVIGNIDATSVSILLKSSIAHGVQIRYGKTPQSLSSSLSRPGTKHDTNAYLSYFELSSLEPRTTYYFQFIDDSKKVIGDDTTVYEFTTSAKRAIPLAIQPVYGKALSPQDIPETQAYVILKSDSFASLITPINTDGTFLFSLCCLVSKNSEVLDTLGETVPVTIEIDTQDKNVLTYVTSLDDIVNTTTLLTVKKGKHSIRKDARAELQNTLKETVIGTATPTPLLIALDGFSLLYPQLNSSIPGERPLFKGNANPNTIVTIQIKEKPDILGRAESNKSGTWTYNPPFKLLSGTYTAIVSGQDRKGIAQRVERSFEIAKGGEAVLGDATGSATLTPSASPTPSEASASPSLTPTETEDVPTVIISPTPPVTGFNPYPLLISSSILIIVGLSVLSFF